jgi:hypothetical protein
LRHNFERQITASAPSAPGIRGIPKSHALYAMSSPSAVTVTQFPKIGFFHQLFHRLPLGKAYSGVLADGK